MPKYKNLLGQWVDIPARWLPPVQPEQSEDPPQEQEEPPPSQPEED
jgi:hypothetical protein